MTVPSASPMISAGTRLADDDLDRLSGETSNCSNVPSSRSRATESAVTTSPIRVVRMATRLGTVLQVRLQVGLNQTRAATTLAGGGGARRAAASSALNRVDDRLA